MTKRILFAGCILVVIHIGLALGYDDQRSHPQITEAAIRNSSGLNSYLQTLLGLEKGFYTRFPSSSNNPKTAALELLKKGSIDEDAVVCRRSTHFHNPLRSWKQAGMDEFLVNNTCKLYRQPEYNSKHSALTWATGYEDYNGSITSRNDQDMGWDNARSYLYTALTSSMSAERDTSFTKTFQSVGQVMHLLQDMAVPAHVRNDFRVISLPSG